MDTTRMSEFLAQVNQAHPHWVVHCYRFDHAQFSTIEAIFPVVSLRQSLPASPPRH